MAELFFLNKDLHIQHFTTECEEFSKFKKYKGVSVTWRHDKIRQPMEYKT